MVILLALWEILYATVPCVKRKVRWWIMEKSQHTEKYRKLITELKVARVRADLTQQEVAEKLGVYNSYVSKCESGERKIDVVELAEFCHVYGLTLSQFLKQIELD